MEKYELVGRTLFGSNGWATRLRSRTVKEITAGVSNRSRNFRGQQMNVGRAQLANVNAVAQGVDPRTAENIKEKVAAIWEE